MKSGWTSSLSDSVIDTNNLGFCDKNFNLFLLLFLIWWKGRMMSYSLLFNYYLQKSWIYNNTLPMRNIFRISSIQRINSGRGGIRTHDLILKRDLLYQLSYTPIRCLQNRSSSHTLLEETAPYIAFSLENSSLFLQLSDNLSWGKDIFFCS